MSIEDSETDYSKMTAEAQSRFASEHFDRLTAEQQMRVALDDFDKGRQLNQQEAGIVDKSLGNSDGVFDNKDLEYIEQKREDAFFMNSLGTAAEAMAGAAALSAGVNSYQAALNGPLGSIFNPAGTGTAMADAPSLFTPISEIVFEKGTLGGLFSSQASGAPDLKAGQSAAEAILEQAGGMKSSVKTTLTI